MYQQETYLQIVLSIVILMNNFFQHEGEKENN